MIYSVNGEKFETDKELHTANEIISIAGRAAGISRKPEEYILERTSGHPRKYQGNQHVWIFDGDTFIAYHIGPTTVA